MPTPGEKYVSTREAIRLLEEVFEGKRPCTVARSEFLNVIINDTYRRDICLFLKALHEELRRDPPPHDANQFLIHLNGGIVRGTFFMGTSIQNQSQLDTLVIVFG